LFGVAFAKYLSVLLGLNTSSWRCAYLSTDNFTFAFTFIVGARDNSKVVRPNKKVLYLGEF